MKILKKSGFTLVEVMLAVGIFTLLMVAIVDLFIKNDSLVSTQSATIGAISGARAILTDVNTSALQATRVMSSHSFNGTTLTSTSTSLVLELPSMNAGGETISGSYDYFGYYATGTEVYRLTDVAAASVRASTTRRLADTISSLTFTYGSSSDPTTASMVQIDVQSQKTVKNTLTQTHERQQVFFRNFISI